MGSMLKAVLCAGVVLVTLLAGGAPVRAEAIPGEYSMTLVVDETSVPVGGRFTMHLGIEAQESPAYLAAQWKVFYVPAAMAVVSITLCR